MATAGWFGPTLIAAVIVASLALAGDVDARVVRADVDVPHAIYAPAGLVNTCHTYKQARGDWPPPGGP